MRSIIVEDQIVGEWWGGGQGGDTRTYEFSEGQAKFVEYLDTWSVLHIFLADDCDLTHVLQ